MGVSFLVVAVLCFDSPIAIAMTGVITTVVSCFINSYPNKKLVGYSYFEQMKDILPSLLLSVLMGAVILLVGMLRIHAFFLLLIQVTLGIAIYLGASVILKPAPYRFIVGQLRAYLNKKKTN